MRRSCTSFAALLAPLLAIAPPAQAQAHVRLGVDRLADSLPAVLVGKRVGLITNHTGRDRAGTPTIDLLAARKDIKLVALFGAEHGIRGVATGRVDDSADEKTGLPVYSLFGATEKPTDAMLENVDALVFDIQDVGVRQYTYLSTMALAMQAAAHKKIPFVVLDRPNPIGGTIVEGNIREPGMESFVGLYPIASRHGLTAGELATLYNKEFGIGADLHVVRLEGWKRELWSDQTDLPWIKPSPNLPTFAGVISYPGTVFFEGTNLSEGRGSDAPFEQTGAPWLRAQEVADSMNARHLPGVQFSARDFAVLPGTRKYGGQTIHGVHITVTDRETYRPVGTTLRLIETIRRLHPSDFQWRHSTASPGAVETYYFDTLTGSKLTRAAIENGTLETLLAEWERDAERFREMRKPYLLY
ncbi:MAG: exo-beta-N-acetylmuramidase NamZ family protein [Gemmatimonadaceae bacterium]